MTNDDNVIQFPGEGTPQVDKKDVIMGQIFAVLMDADDYLEKFLTTVKSYDVDWSEVTQEQWAFILRIVHTIIEVEPSIREAHGDIKNLFVGDGGEVIVDMMTDVFNTIEEATKKEDSE